MQSNRLETQQRQLIQQRLSPMQLRYVRMLEMTGPEIEEEVARALDEFPALEIDHQPEQEIKEEVLAREQSVDFDPEDGEKEAEYPEYRSHETGRDYLYNVASSGLSLTEHLESQLRLNQVLAPEEALAAKFIISSLDANGYLRCTLKDIKDDIAQAYGANVPEAALEKGWDAVRALDPPGVGAADLRDCLLLQLEAKEEETEPRKDATEIVRHGFDLLASRNLPALVKELKLTPQRVQAALSLITSLDPKPGSAFSSSEINEVNPSPDFVVEIPEGEDSQRLRLWMPNKLPKLVVESSFEVDDLSAAKSSHHDSRAWTRKQRDDAREYIRILHDRQTALLQIMEAIVKFQTAFFISGDKEQLRPMRLQQISEATGRGLSTISRALRSKLVATPQGHLMPVKDLFAERLLGRHDAETSEEQTRGRAVAALRSIIEKEDKRAPLSDQALSEALQKEGFSDVARRTVTKYRQSEGIPIARMRRQLTSK